jgi:hypothetical protein
MSENNQVSVKEEMKNEVAAVAQSGNYAITKDENGKFKRKAVYSHYSSVVPETKEQKVAMFNLLNGDDEQTAALGEHIGALLQVANVIHNPYDSLNEDTGELEYGVLTYLFTPEDQVFVTSSKSVYHTLQNVYKVWGEPTSWEEPLKFKVVKKKGREHQYTDIKIML